ncbi:MAG: DUF3341 domain-containing protein [Oligoflexia bacterium]|nr:DUF3341 domain-containing protein [Oligoflexia bacterium]
MAKSCGVFAVFKSEDDLVRAAKAGREQKNFKFYDAFTPYPIHGLDDVMGIRRSFLPWVTFVFGIIGTITALILQIWTSAFDWALNVGGKPYTSLPAFIPVVFELTVLFGGLGTVAALFYVCKMPNLNPRILHPDITKDRFVLFVPSNEAGYNEGDVIQFLKGFKPEEVSAVTE